MGIFGAPSEVLVWHDCAVDLSKSIGTTVHYFVKRDLPCR